jgi:hypothetical protein
MFMYLLPLCCLTMAINPVRINYFKVCGFIHSRYKFFVQVNIISETVENLFSAGLMNENPLKTYKLQHLVYSGLGQVFLIFIIKIKVTFIIVLSHFY